MSSQKKSLFLVTRFEKISAPVLQDDITISSSQSSSVIFKKAKESRKRKRKFGRWTPQENSIFLEELLKPNNNWKFIQSKLKTRTTAQIRSHAQKLFIKLKNRKLLEIPLATKTLKEYLKYIASLPNEKCLSIVNVIKAIANDCEKKRKLPKNALRKNPKINNEVNSITIDEDSINNSISKKEIDIF